MIFLHIMKCSIMFSVILWGLINNCDGSNIGSESYFSDDVKREITPNRPNIVVLVADDMGWGDMGANWPGVPNTVGSLVHAASKTVTPNMDSLAKEGLRFTDFHSAASVCAPSRAALLTSRLGLRTGVVQNFGVDAVGGLPANETTIAKILLDAGYRTAMFGKWHLGLTKGHHPMDHGFQSYLGVPYSVDMGCTNPPGLNIPTCSGCSYGNDVSRWEWESGTAYSQESQSACREDVALPLMSNRTIVHQPIKLDKLSSMYGTFAENFILDCSENCPPFFLYGAFSHMHVPLLTEHGSNRKSKVYKEALAEMDKIVGRVAKAAKKLKSQHKASVLSAPDTLIWFLSDNGPWEVKCELSGSWGPFSGDWQRNPSGGGGGGASKQTVWEGGHRVPSFIHWPTHIKGDRTCNALISAMDIMPTLAHISRAKMPKHRFFDGKDVSEILLKNDEYYQSFSSKDLKHGDTVLFHPNSGASGQDGEIGAVRIGEYKAVLYSGGSPDCSGYYPPRANHSNKPLIFNLHQDPAEAKPLSTKTNVYKVVESLVNEALYSLSENIKADNVSVADFSSSPAARLCCSKESFVCRCPWD